MQYTIRYFTILSSLFLLTIVAKAQFNGDFKITQSVIASGGSTSTSDNNTVQIFSLSGTIGQPAAGTLSSDTPFNIFGGFWHLEFASIDSPDLTITKTHNGNFSQRQTDAQYFITVTNNGNAASNGTVTLTDTLPNGLTATVIAGNGWNCTLANLTCTRNDALAAGNSYPAITLKVNVASDAPSSVTNTATVSGGGDTNAGNNTADDVTNIEEPSADITVTVKDSPPTVVTPDGDLNYEIRFTNNGPDAAREFILTAIQPDTVTFVGVGSTGTTQGAGTSCRYFSQGPARYVCTDASFAVGATGAFILRAKVNANVPIGTIISNTVSVSSNTVDPNNDNNTATATTTVATAHTGPLTVDNTTDNPDLWACTEAAANDCSLRAAIEVANPGDTINFDPAVFSAPQIIELATEELFINKSLTINGTGTENLIIRRSAAEGTPKFRIFHIMGVHVTIYNLTITGGDADSDQGGGIYKRAGGSLTLDRVSVTGNTAGRGGGISDFSNTLTINNSNISGNTAVINSVRTSYGGGMAIGNNQATISNTTISDNTALSGGGIFNNGDALSVINSTISGNTVNVTTSGAAGGIHNSNFGTLTITNSTISGNSVLSAPNGVSNAGAIQHFGGAVGGMTLTNCTITNNFAGGYRSASGVRFGGGIVIVRNTIIAANQNNTESPDVLGELSFTSQGYNLIGNVGAATGFNQTGDQTGGNGNPVIDPRLAALANNGGATQTHALLPDSPAIDKGKSLDFNTDQRGLARPFDNPTIQSAPDGDNSDIGAFEMQTDVTAPNTIIGSNPTNPSNSNSASFSFSGINTDGSNAANFECDLDGAGFEACISPQTYNNLSDGSHTFMVRVIDNTGNVDATPASFTWTVDTIAPDTTINFDLPGTSNLTHAAFGFTGADADGTSISSFECNLDGSGFTPCTSSKSYSGLSEGNHTFEVRAVDPAGNVDQTPAFFAWTIDTNAPTVTINQAASQSDPANGMGIMIHFTAVFSEPVTDFTGSDVTLSGTAGAATVVVTEIAPNNGTTFDVAVGGMTSEGAVTASIPANAAQDAATNGNTASTSTDNTVTYVPNTPPAANPDSYSTAQNTTLSVAAPGVLSNDSDPDMGDTITAVLVNSPTNAASFALNADGSFNYSPAMGFTGTDSFTYKAKDNFNAESSVVAVTLSVQYRFDWFYYSNLLLSEQILNQVTAGSNVPIRFTLYGNKGNPYNQPPTSQQISCSTFAPTGAAATINRFAPDPYYSSLYDFYQTTWQTQGAWKFTCRELTLHLNDGKTRKLKFYFK